MVPSVTRPMNIRQKFCVEISEAIQSDIHSFCCREIGTVSGFKSFRRFLRDCPGETILELYLNLETIRLCSDRIKKEDLVKSLHTRTISLAYIPEGIAFVLQNAFQRINNGTEEVNSVLVDVQTEAASYLCFYWMKRYIVHRAMITKEKDETSKMICQKFLSPCEEWVVSEEKKIGFSEHPVCACCQLCYWAGRSPLKASTPTHKDRTVVVLPSLSKQLRFDGSLVTQKSKPSISDSIVVSAIVADELAGNPFLQYLQRRGKHQAGNGVLFLRQVEKLLAGKSINSILVFLPAYTEHFIQGQRKMILRKLSSQLQCFTLRMGARLISDCQEKYDVIL